MTFCFINKTHIYFQLCLLYFTELGRLKSHLKREDPSFLQPRFPFNERCIVLNLIEIGIVCLKFGNECLLFGYYRLLEKDVVL